MGRERPLLLVSRTCRRSPGRVPPPPLVTFLILGNQHRTPTSHPENLPLGLPVDVTTLTGRFRAIIIELLTCELNTTCLIRGSAARRWEGVNLGYPWVLRRSCITIRTSYCVGKHVDYWAERCVLFGRGDAVLATYLQRARWKPELPSRHRDHAASRAYSDDSGGPMPCAIGCSNEATRWQTMPIEALSPPREQKSISRPPDTSESVDAFTLRNTCMDGHILVRDRRSDDGHDIDTPSSPSSLICWQESGVGLSLEWTSVAHATCEPWPNTPHTSLTAPGCHE